MQQDISGGPGTRRENSFFTAVRRIGILSAVLGGVFGSGAALAEGLLPASVKSAALKPAGKAGPTAAWIEFCGYLPEECAVDVPQPDTIALNRETWDLIVGVNERVNGAILPVTDQDHWGVQDRWDYPEDGLGDCEDIQLLKRRLLTQAGLPQRALRMTVVIDERGEGHAVLMVRTDRGDFILDNKRDAVLTWQQTGYRYVKREGSDSAAWVWLGNVDAPLVTANK